MHSRTQSFLDTQIILVDRSSTADDPPSLVTSPALANTELQERDTPPASPSVESPLRKKLTSNSLNIHQSVRQQVAKQKYKKYGQERYDVGENELSRPPTADLSASGSASYLDRGRAKAKELMRKKKGMGKGFDSSDAVVDVLWENQRGVFFFGIPRYSSNSLLPSDPKPWQNAQFRTSPVDIRNAQVPDPSWEWAWKSWYVDMSRDVDEEGWEYSFAFKVNFNWHGNHPWFHSFVRRRRWLRMRRRKDPGRHLTAEKAHELTAEYFTIHPKTMKATSEFGSTIRNEELRRQREALEADPEMSNMEINDIGSLVRVLKRASVDREKLVAVRKFIAEGGDELHYLSQRMEDIMNLFLYQNSRRQLLAELASHHDEASKEQEKLQQHQHHDDDTQNEHDNAVRHADNLMKAVQAAEEQVKRLEYWSDIKEMAQDGELVHAKEWNDIMSSPTGHPEESFASKQDPSTPAKELHKHPEHTKPSKTRTPSTAKIKTPSTDPGESSSAPSKKSSIWFDAQESLKSPKEESSDGGGSELDRYTTAAESASEMGSPEVKGKSKVKRGPSRLISMDGILEADGTEEAAPAGAPAMFGVEVLPPSGVVSEDEKSE